MATGDAMRWALLSAPSLFLLNWAAVLLAVAALTLRRREGYWPRWRPLTQLAAGIAASPRHRARTLLLAGQLLLLDLLAPFLAVLMFCR